MEFAATDKSRQTSVPPGEESFPSCCECRVRSVRATLAPRQVSLQTLPGVLRTLNCRMKPSKAFHAVKSCMHSRASIKRHGSRVFALQKAKTGSVPNASAPWNTMYRARALARAAPRPPRPTAPHSTTQASRPRARVSRVSRRIRDPNAYRIYKVVCSRRINMYLRTLRLNLAFML